MSTRKLRIAGVLLVVVGFGLAASVLRERPTGHLFAGEKGAKDDKKNAITNNALVPVPTLEQLRTRYVQLHEELSRRLTGVQLQRKVAELEREVAAAKEQERQTLREKKASEELDKVKKALDSIASSYPNTQAGIKARQALQATAASPSLPPPFAIDVPYPKK